MWVLWKYLTHFMRHEILYYAKIFKNGHIFTNDDGPLKSFLKCIYETEIITETWAAHDLLNSRLSSLFCSEKGKMCYLVQYNEFCHSDPTNLRWRTLRSSTFSHFFPKTGSKRSRPWYHENSKSIWETLNASWRWKRGGLAILIEIQKHHWG